MNNSTIVANSIEALNKDRVACALSKAKGIISAIEAEQASIVARNEQIKGHSEELKKLETLDVTYASVTGGTAPTDPNVNQAAILKTIEDLQKVRSEAAAAKAKSITEVIAARQEQNKAALKRIADYRADLLKVEVTEVKASDIVG